MKRMILLMMVIITLLIPNRAWAQEPAGCEFDYTVQAGDWLSKIAEKYYGDVLAFSVIVDATNDQTGDTYVDIDNPDVIEPGWLLCIPPDDDTATGSPAAPEGLSPEELANTTYKSEWTQDGMAPLTNGEYSEAAAPGSATMTQIMLTDNIAYGELNGQPAAAVVLVTNPGGSGTFYDLALVVNQDGSPVNVATTNLGDRVKLNSIAIENNEVVVDMVTQGPDDPFCCPTQQVIKRYTLQGDQLVESSSEDVGSSAGDSDTNIVGIIWNWQSFKDQSGQNDMTVPNPDNYRLELLPDGQFRFKADCNSGSGSYTLDGSSLTLTLGPVTLAECGPGSLYNEYISQLGQVATYVRSGNNLVLNLVADAGNMNYSKLQAVTGQIVAPEGATLPEGAQLEIKVSDVSLADAPATQIGGQTISDVTQFPIDFEAPYKAEVIDERFSYAVQARITDQEGNLLYINTQSFPVITRDNPTYNVEVMVEPVN